MTDTNTPPPRVEISKKLVLINSASSLVTRMRRYQVGQTDKPEGSKLCAAPQGTDPDHRRLIMLQMGVTNPKNTEKGRKRHAITLFGAST